MTSDAQLLGPLLKQVSRSFYLTLRVLPAAIRPQISVAYLLARATDTIADAEQTAQPERIAVLRELSAGRISARPVVEQIGVAEATPAEAELLKRLPAVFDCLATFAVEDQRRIRELLHTIIGGQIFDLERFPGPPLNDDELDRYTYMVAGCVGEFWTKMCQAHLPGLAALSVVDGIRFGKGLQLVNILRDVAEDQRRGRQYVTDVAAGLDQAAEHLDAGWRYTLAIPADQKRLRLACVWPIWIGLKTLARLRVNPAGRVKVSRGEVYWVMLESALLAGNAAALDEVYQRLRNGK
ncbi:MAG: squalene/phytoene synthase family protein [Verrucomicrobiota bacterium]